MTPHRIDGGYSVSGGTCKHGWYAGVLLLDELDFKTYESDLPARFEERVERCRLWQPRLVSRPRRIELVTPAAGGTKRAEAASAERIDGPACPRERVADPLLAWTELRDGQWRLALYHESATFTALRQKGMLRRPQVASTPNGLLFACERETGAGETEAVLCDLHGRELFRTAGRNPRLAATAGGVALLTEQCSRNRIFLRLTFLRSGRVQADHEIRAGDYTFNADLAHAGEGSSVFVAAETCPAFGEGSQFGKHRDIAVWRCTAAGVEPVAEGNGNALPVERRAFQSIGPENLPPIRPQVFVEDGSPVVVFRQFRYHGFKTFGWDVFWCRRQGPAWAPPVRLSPCLCLPDAGCAVLPLGGRYAGMFPALDNEGRASRTCGHRVEIHEFEAGLALPRFEVEPAKSRPYHVPPSCAEVAPEPPAAPVLYAGRTLIWGDLHVHSAYSKCVGAADGSPAEKLRFARDALGCRVFTLTEHTPDQSSAELTWCMDQLELAAGDGGIVLYGAEPGLVAGRHTNFYAHDRSVFERLAVIFNTHRRDRLLAYRQILEELPWGSVVAIQHFHGNVPAAAESLQSFEPRLEVAMEAMQGRCNALLEANDEDLPFPTPFLNMGCKVGIVGGTDHFRGGPNRFGLTGFWVKEISAGGVWEALRNRYTLGVSNAKVALAATLDGQPMGSSVVLAPSSPVRIRLSAACGRNIRRAALIRDGEVLPWAPVNCCSATLELIDPAPPPGRHWYIPTVEVDTAFGADTPGYGHTSPFFVRT